jgi:putative transposase
VVQNASSGAVTHIFDLRKRIAQTHLAKIERCCAEEHCGTITNRALARPRKSHFRSVTIEWLSDNGSCYIAGDTRSFARDVGLEPRTTPIESSQSNGMAEAFHTIKRDYVRVSPRPNAESVMRQLPSWIAHYNEVHPLQPAMAIGARALQCRSQRFQMFLGWRRNRLSHLHDVGNENS